MERIKFVIAEKSYLIRKGIVSIINRIEHATVVKELENLDGINSAILKYNPDFLLVNLSLLNNSMDFRNSVIKADLSEIGIGISQNEESGNKEKFKLREIIGVLDEKELIYKKLEALIHQKTESNLGFNLQSGLSDREKTILKHVARGLTNKEIAETLFLSAHTVITHRKNITNKLNIKTISGLTVYSILNNIISIDDLD